MHISGGRWGASAPSSLSLTVDTPGVYTVYSFRPDYVGVMGDIGRGGLVNASGTTWGAFQYQIVAAPPGGSTFAAYLGATAAGLGPGPYSGFDFAVFSPDRTTVNATSNSSLSLPYVFPGQEYEFGIELNLAAGTTVIQEFAVLAAVPEPSSVIATTSGLLIAAGYAGARRRSGQRRP